MRNTRLRTARQLSTFEEYEHLNMLTLGDRSGGFILNVDKPIDEFIKKLHRIEQPILTLKVSIQKLRAYENKTFLDRCYMNTDSIKIGNAVFSALRLSILLKFLGTNELKIYQLEEVAPIRIETKNGTAYLAPIILDVSDEEFKTIESITTFTS